MSFNDSQGVRTVSQQSNYYGGGCSQGPVPTTSIPGYGGGCSQGPVPTTSIPGYIVPAYSTIGYQALTAQGRNPYSAGGNYFTFADAYGYGADNCQQQYTGSLC